MDSDSTVPAGSRGRLVSIGILAISIMAPVTLPVPILRELVGERFDVSELLTSLFMSVNMIGAALAAPIAGALADRLGRRRPLVIGALLVDAGCFLAMTADVPFGVFLGIRFFEGCAHIFALSLLLSIAAQMMPSDKRGLSLGITGSGMMLGVALGAPIGGFLGSVDPLRPIFTGSALLVGAAALAVFALPDPSEIERRPGIAAIWATMRVSRRSATLSN